MTTTTLQVVINGNEVQGTASQLAQLLGIMSDVVDQKVAPVVDNKPAGLAPFNEFVIDELTPVFGKNVSKRIVSLLEVCRRSYDFAPFRIAYKWAEKDNIEQRQLLLTVSAAYRFKFGILEHGKSKLKSQIKFDTMCPHCGALAIKLIERLKVEGLWV